MGKKDNKKKGKGAEKTAAKTEKKANTKLTKAMKAKGEDDVETMLAKFVAKEKSKTEIVEIRCKEPPSKRTSGTLVPHPEKEKLVLFGGEFFNGTESVAYNDLFVYTPKQDRWHLVESPRGPPPRAAHQSVVIPSGGGQMWVFGGEFPSKSQSQFHHYKDLWMFSFKSKTWHKIDSPGGPSSRSAHRMVVNKKKIYLFGGFHNNGVSSRYFNDVYIFNLEDFKWTKIEPAGKGPSPRSGCGMAASSDGRIVIYGGYSITSEQGKESETTHEDMFYLVPDKHDTSGLKHKWVRAKQTGDLPSPTRCSFAFTSCSSIPGLSGWGEDKAILFGGVTDQSSDDSDEDSDNDDEEDHDGDIHGDIYLLDLNTARWTELRVTGSKNTDSSKSKIEEMDEEKVYDNLEDLSVKEETSTFGAFTITQSTSSAPNEKLGQKSSLAVGKMLVGRGQSVFTPPPRFGAALAVRKGALFLYGGIFEAGDKMLALADMYSLDLTKLEEWKTIIALKPEELEWFESDSEDESDSDSESDDDMECE